MIWFLPLSSLTSVLTSLNDGAGSGQVSQMNCVLPESFLVTMSITAMESKLRRAMQISDWMKKRMCAEHQLASLCFLDALWPHRCCTFPYMTGCTFNLSRDSQSHKELCLPYAAFIRYSVTASEKGGALLLLFAFRCFMLIRWAGASQVKKSWSQIDIWILGDP